MIAASVALVVVSAAVLFGVSLAVTTLALIWHENTTWQTRVEYVGMSGVWWVRVQRDGHGAAGTGRTRRDAIRDAQQAWLQEEIRQQGAVK